MCGKCDGAMRYDESTNTIYYRKNGQWIPLPVDALPDQTIPAPDPNNPTPNSSDNACYKANGIWNYISRAFDVLTFYANASTFADDNYYDFQRHAADVDADNAKLFKFFIDWTDGILTEGIHPDTMLHWESNLSFIRQDFICLAQNAFSKGDRLTNDDYATMLEIADDLDTGNNQLNDLLYDVVKVVERKAYDLAAYNAVQAQIGTCNCGNTGNTLPDEEADWVHVFDFTTNSNLGFTPYPRGIEAGNMTAPTPSADGLRATVTDYSSSPVVRRGVYVHKALIGGDSTTRIISVQAEYGGVVDSTESNVPVGERGLQVAFTEAGGTHLEAQGGNGGVNIPSGSSLLAYSPYLRVAAGNYLKVYFQVGQRNTSDTSVDGDGYLRKLTVKGKGTNPFA